MAVYTDFFSQKIQELNAENQKLLGFLEHVRSGNVSTKLKYMEILQLEFQERMKQLKDEIENSRSQAMKELAKVQYEYFDSMKTLLQNKLPLYLHSEVSDEMNDREEAGYLYTEFAFELIRQSLISATIAYMDILEPEGGNV